MQHSNTAGCILLKFYIKPQHTANVYNLLYVVSYRNSTSNHNMSHWRATSQGVVSYRNSTSNHNQTTARDTRIGLYLIEILHQTTTVAVVAKWDKGCILSKFYIKPQLTDKSNSCSHGCILSKFYIKPQHSDHLDYAELSCILSKFYIKPQHVGPAFSHPVRCILSKFYIKPQPTSR